jgi:MscS family membrane protein
MQPEAAQETMTMTRKLFVGAVLVLAGGPLFAQPAATAPAADANAAAQPAAASAATQPAPTKAEPVLSWARGTFLGNTIWQWLGLLGVLLVSFVVGKVVSYVLEHQAEKIGKVPQLLLVSTLLRSLAGPVKMLALAGGLYVASVFMTLATKGMQELWLRLCTTLAVLAAGWFIYRLVDVVEHFLSRWTAKTDTQLDDQLVPLLRKTLRVFVVILAVLFIAQNIFEWDIAALITGLGIGGLAFALAAKDTLANLFGSVTIFADRPFQLGDRVKIHGHDGAVEEVGFRSTRIRTLTGHLVTIPNSIVANETIENIAKRPYIKRVLEVTVTYDTPAEKLERGIEILHEMLEARKEHFPEANPPRVFFTDFAATSLNINVTYWFAPPDWSAYLQFTHDFNMELLRRFNAEGIEFAFPTQTLYVKQDSPLAADVNVTAPGR